MHWRNRLSSVAGIETLPSTLSKEEIYYLLECYKSGGQDPKDEIITRNLKYIINFVSSISCTDFDKDDLFQEGVIGLIKAYYHFDPSLNYEFMTMASVYIKNEILMYMRKNKRHTSKVISFSEILCTDSSGNHLLLGDVCRDEFAEELMHSYENEVVKNIILDLIDELPEAQRKTLSYYFGINGFSLLNQEEIAKELNCSQSYVSKLIVKALKQISSRMQEIGVLETTKNNNEFKKKKVKNNKTKNEISE